MYDTPEYSKYTLEELYDSLENIDRKQFPERVQRIKEQINLKLTTNDTYQDQEDFSDLFERVVKKHRMLLSVLVFILGLVSIVIGKA